MVKKQNKQTNERTNKQANKQTSKQTNKHMNTHEKPWTPISTHEMKCIPVIVHVFSKTNLADKLLCVQLLDHCFHNFWFIILGVWSCIFFIQCLFFQLFYISFHVFFPSRAGLAPTKTIHCHCCKTYVDIYLHMYLYRTGPLGVQFPHDLR